MRTVIRTVVNIKIREILSFRPAAAPFIKWLYRGVRKEQRARDVLSTNLDDVRPTWL